LYSINGQIYLQLQFQLPPLTAEDFDKWPKYSKYSSLKN